MPVLLDLAATERAHKCRLLLLDQEAIAAAKPFEVVVEGWNSSKCSLKPRDRSEEFVYKVGGFELLSYKDCDQVRASLADELPRYENNLNVRAALFCGADGKPTVEPDNAVKLEANVELSRRLPEVVRRVNQGIISAEISDCYFGVKSQLSKLSEPTNALRCKILTSDLAVEGVTYAALWERAQIEGDLSAYKLDNSEMWNQAQRNDTVSVFYDRFTLDAKDRACAEEQDEQSLTAQRDAVRIAADTCL